MLSICLRNKIEFYYFFPIILSYLQFVSLFKTRTYGMRFRIGRNRALLDMSTNTFKHNGETANQQSAWKFAPKRKCIR